MFQAVAILRQPFFGCIGTRAKVQGKKQFVFDSEFHSHPFCPCGDAATEGAAPNFALPYCTYGRVLLIRIISYFFHETNESSDDRGHNRMIDRDRKEINFRFKMGSGGNFDKLIDNPEGLFIDVILYGTLLTTQILLDTIAKIPTTTHFQSLCAGLLVLL